MFDLDKTIDKIMLYENMNEKSKYVYPFFKKQENKYQSILKLRKNTLKNSLKK